MIGVRGDSETIFLSKKMDHPGSKKGLAKTFSITIMRLPCWKRRRLPVRSVEVGSDYFLVVFAGY
jgi:hypothetical protein